MILGTILVVKCDACPTTKVISDARDAAIYATWYRSISDDLCFCPDCRTTPRVLARIAVAERVVDRHVSTREGGVYV